MVVYTCSEEIKDKLLNNGQVLIKVRELKNKTVYLFKINDMSCFEMFSHEENKLIFFDNKMTF